MKSESDEHWEPVKLTDSFTDLRKRRLQLQLTQAEVARILNVTAQNYAKIEEGKIQIPALRASALAALLKWDIARVYDLILLFKRNNELN